MGTGKRLRVLPMLPEKGEVRARAFRSWERGRSFDVQLNCARSSMLLHLLSAEGRMGVRPNSCPRWWGRGLDQYVLKGRQK